MSAPLPQDYRAFCEAKVKVAEPMGFDIDPASVNPALKPHVRKIVPWMIKGGRRAVFASFGLHKTSMQIEAMRQIGKHKGGAQLITLPLGVRQEFIRESAERFTGDYAAPVRFIRRTSEVNEPGIYLTNFESVREGNVDPGAFNGASLDEGAILRDYGSKTYQEFLPLFGRVPYRFVATAVPSPNRTKELIHYAGWLGVMDTGQALTRFFQRDSEKAGNLTLYPHKEDEFWLWVASWAVFIQKPSDLGFSDEGYTLPALDVRWHEIPSDHKKAGEERDGQGLLFRNVATGINQAAAEKRDSIKGRVAKMTEILAEDPSAHCILWHDLESEREAIEKAVPRAVSVYGSQDLDERERRIIGFSDGAFPYLAGKPQMLGSGCNFQRHCHRAVFLGVGHKFHDFIQAIFRIQRFGQVHPCRVDMIHTEAEREVVRDLKRKWAEHDEMARKMSAIIQKYGLDHIPMYEALKRSIGVERVEVRGERFTIANNDCVAEAKLQPEDHVDLMVTSIPFANHYEYTPTYEDFGHTDDNAHFWAQMDFLTPELLRILKPGRLACIHVKDRVMFGSVTGAGAPTISPFHCEAVQHYRAHGFDYMGMITVVTDVVRENNQTYRLGWSENAKDSTKMGVGCPEYVLLMRKPQSNRGKGYADLPVTKDKAAYTRARWQVDAHALWRSSGNRSLTAEELAALGPAKLAQAFTAYSLDNVYDYEFHVRIGEELEARGALPSTFMSLAPGSAHPDVWHDVLRMRTLNGDQAKRNVEQHLCPLQFDIVDRLIERYSNPDELVYDPFGGLMTVPYRAILSGRRGQASELSPRYFMDGAYYCRAAEDKRLMPALFDLAPHDEEAA